MRVLIINNLSSGLRNGTVHDFMRILAQDGDEITLRSTDGRTRIQTQLDDARDYDVVVAAGGDSTVSAVTYELRNSGVPILPFPSGTANLVANNLEMPDEPSALARMTRTLKTSDYDVGEMVFQHDGASVTRGFEVIAGAGYDATIMRRAEKLKDPLGVMAYFAAAISEPNPKVASYKVTLDDEVLEMDGIAVLVINFAKIYDNISITHENNAADGFFEVVIVKKQHTIELVPAFFAAVLDSMGSWPDRADAIESRLSKRVLVEANISMSIQLDGETPQATTPFEARILPGAARYVVL